MAMPVIAWSPWVEHAVRLHAEGKGAGEIAQILGKETIDIITVMDMPEFKEALEDKRKALDLLFFERIVQLWDLSDTMVTVAKEIAQSFLDKLAGETPEKELRALRRDAIEVMKDVLDRIGLRAPERVEQKITSVSTTEDKTPLEVYEKRLQLVREYKEAGEPIPDGLCKVDLNG